jgi:predicted membrane protein
MINITNRFIDDTRMERKREEKKNQQPYLLITTIQLRYASLILIFTFLKFLLETVYLFIVYAFFCINNEKKKKKKKEREQDYHHHRVIIAF